MERGMERGLVLKELLRIEMRKLNGYAGIHC